MSPEAVLEVRDFAGSGDPGYLLAPPIGDQARFEQALGSGSLELQACADCGRVRHPVAPACPYCTATGFRWTPVSATGRVFSWVRYRKCYLPEFESLMPYVVVYVELDAGPRLFGRLLDARAEPRSGLRVRLVAERWPDGRHVPAFAVADE